MCDERHYKPIIMQRSCSVDTVGPLPRFPEYGDICNRKTKSLWERNIYRHHCRL